MIGDLSDGAVRLPERRTSTATSVERTHARRRARARRFESLFPWGVWVVAVGIAGWMVV